MMPSADIAGSSREGSSSMNRSRSAGGLPRVLIAPVSTGASAGMVCLEASGVLQDVQTSLDVEGIDDPVRDPVGGDRVATDGHEVAHLADLPALAYVEEARAVLEEPRHDQAPVMEARMLLEPHRGTTQPIHRRVPVGIGPVLDPVLVDHPE